MSVPQRQSNDTDKIIESVNLSFQEAKAKFGFPIIGIGASAGGLESLEELFSQISINLEAAYVVVQHLSPDFKSMMDEILSRRTKLQVRRIEDGMRVEPKTVYLIPPNADLIVEDETLRLRPRELNQGLNQPIDRFFSSLASSRGPACAAVVCSGSGSDGSRGIRDICEAGGMVLVESPESAKFDGMPKSAMETGVADFSGEIHQIATWLGRFIQSFEDRTESGRYSDTGDLLAHKPAIGLSRVIELLRAEYQINFAQYKPNMILRRIERRWHLLQFESIDEYVELLESDRDELNRVYRDLLIGVTRFFRDPESFKALSESVLPRLIEECDGDAMRVWTPGCATGEEAYSLAITIREIMEAKGRYCDVKIFATDAHRQSLEKAAAGVYSREELEGVSAERLAAHFQAVGNNYQLNQSIRQMIVFAPQNLLSDAAFTNIDLVVCRNTLIYFGNEGQRRALSLMHFGLRIGGVLFLGPSETPGEILPDFETIDRRWRIYRKVSAKLVGSASFRAPDRLPKHRPDSKFQGATKAIFTDRMILSAIEDVAEEYLPPTFVTNASSVLLYSTPGSSKFLRRQEGRFGATLPELLLPVLRTSVLVGLQRCARLAKSEPIVVGKIAVPSSTFERKNGNEVGANLDGETTASDSSEDFQLVELIIRRVELAGQHEHCFCVSIVERNQRLVRTGGDELARAELTAQATLEEELRHTKESLQATIQELETSNEELQATNEEMVASNEELQSTNEELHSVNEELYTVNAEHQSKIEELTELSEDMENLFRSSNVATLFLDGDSRIRRMTPKAAEIFGLNYDDIGRRLDNFRNPLVKADLYDLIEAVFETQEWREMEVMSTGGERYLLRLMPYHSSRDSTGTVITLVSLQRLENARQELETRELRFRGTFENAAVGIAHVDTRGNWLRVNQRLCDLVGYEREELLKTDFQTITHPDDLSSDIVQFEQLKAGSIESYKLQKRYIHKQGFEVPIDLTVSMQVEPNSAEPYCIAIIQDASERVTAYRKLEDAIRQRDQFLAVLSHELRNPLGAVRNAVTLLERNDVSDTDQADLVDLLGRQTNHMSRLIEDLLDTSRIAQGKIVLQRELMDLQEIAHESIRSLKNGFDEKQQSISLELIGDEFPVIGDRVRLLQVVENLLTNARRYTQPGGKIVLKLEVADGRVLLSVSDNGSGISKGNIESIFEMFARGHGTEETQGGLGVGLALVKILVEKHQGLITAESEGKGEGAVFTISLPLVPIPEGVDLLTGKESQSPSLNESQSFRLVLIEDDVDARSTLQKLLELEGHEVFVAVDGFEGIKKLAELKPEFALVDLSMPGMSGFEMVKRLRDEYPSLIHSTKMIALTGHGQPQDKRRTASAGFSGHLVKPINVPELEHLLMKLSSELDAERS